MNVAKTGMKAAFIINILKVVAILCGCAFAIKSCADAGGVGSVAGEIAKDYEEAKGE